MKRNLDFTPFEARAKQMNAKRSEWAVRFDGNEWTYLDEQRLVNLFMKTNESIEEISKILGRSVVSVEAKLKSKYGPDVLQKT